MTEVYRMQKAGIPFDEMKTFNSSNWTTGEQLLGLCAALHPEDLVDLAKHWYHGKYDGQEVVVFDANILDDVGDGYLTEPISESYRVPLQAFVALHPLAWEVS